jgi:hypothetical protein
MNRTPVESSQLASCGYDPKNQTLEIEFKAHKGANSTYEYYGVPAATYAALMGAESKGRYFKQNIRGAYQYKKLS